MSGGCSTNFDAVAKPTDNESRTSLWGSKSEGKKHFSSLLALLSQEKSKMMKNWDKNGEIDYLRMNFMTCCK